MVGTVVVLETIDDRHSSKHPIKKVRIDWTSDASGDATEVLANVNGFLIGLETNPDGVAVPTSYNVTLVDEDGYDCLEGVGAGRSTTATEKELVLKELGIAANNYAGHPAVCGSLTFTIDTAGNAKKGIATLYFR